jgi:hypothetical protein
MFKFLRFRMIVHKGRQIAVPHVFHPQESSRETLADFSCAFFPPGTSCTAGVKFLLMQLPLLSYCRGSMRMAGFQRSNVSQADRGSMRRTLKRRKEALQAPSQAE